jgi:hypothetical protein
LLIIDIGERMSEVEGITRRSLLLGMGALPVVSSTGWALHKRLLLDSRIIERSEGARLTIGQVRKEPRNPLFGEDRPWEVRIDNLYGNVLYDDEDQVYKLWYSPFMRRSREESTPPEKRASTPYELLPRGTRDMAVCYATSKDGISWEKPELGLFEFRGSKRNNIVMGAPSLETVWEPPHGAGIFKDLRDPDPARRYKMIFMRRPRDGSRDRAGDMPRHLCVSFSRDGLHWQDPIPLKQPVMSGDTHNNALWAPSLGKYVAFTRRKIRGRIVTRAESEDFLHWSAGENVLRSLPSEPGRQTYAMPVFAYANVYLGLVMMMNLHPEDRTPGNDTVDCELAWSPDTVRWERVCAGIPLIPRGPKGSSPDWGCIFGCSSPVLRDGTLRLYYGGNNGYHTDWRDGFLCLAYLRPDGFAGMEPEKSGRAGNIVTRPLENRSGTLRVSADAKGGALTVGVLDDSGRSMAESSPIRDDVTDAPVRWTKGDFGSLAGKTIRLQFDLRGARLYSFSLG